MNKVSVIIPTYNRFKSVLNAIDSVRHQTYKNIEIIVINDCSSEKEYYEYNFGDNIKIIHLTTNSKEIFGIGCAGYVRNVGIKQSTGQYIAFLDDDDSWFPLKIELQLYAMKQTGCKMSCTDGLIGHDIIYNSQNTKNYRQYNADYFLNEIQQIYKNNNSTLLDKGYPNIWDLQFLKIHNCAICSSVVVEKSILEQINYMSHDKQRQEDYKCWLKVLEHTNCVYIRDICFYYYTTLEMRLNSISSF